MKPAKTPLEPAVRLVEVDEHHTGQRLDNFLIGRLKGVPKSHIYRILRRGEVRINKGRSRPEYRLRKGDVVRIPPVRTAEVAAAPVGTRRVEFLRDRVLHEDAGLLVLDKPAGLAVHGGSGVSLGAIEALRALRPECRFLELIHRLDRDTSGCLLIAKKRATLTALHALLRESAPGQGVDKRYLALVKGRWPGGARDVTVALQKNVLRSGERVVNVTRAGKGAHSVFTPLRRFAQATLVEIRLLTGRTHQARVHAAHIGHPIAGDEKYGEREFNRQMRALGLERLFLHAASVTFSDPASGERRAFAAPLPDDLAAFLERLQHAPKI